jgi:Piwi domain
MALPAGTYINAFPVTLEDPQPVTRIECPRDAPIGQTRRGLEERFSTPIIIDRGYAWTAVALEDQERVDLTPDEFPNVHVFNLREGIRLRAESAGWEFWINRGEMSAVEPGDGEVIDPFEVQAVLRMRATWEGVGSQQLLLLAGSSVRWLVREPLEDPDVMAVAPGEYVVRRPGVLGVQRAQVQEITDGRLLLVGRGGAAPSEANPADYQLVARPSLVYALMGRRHTHAEAAAVYNLLLVASRTLMARSNAPNKYAAKERYFETERLLDQFGRSVPLANGTAAEIAAAPRELYPTEPPAREPWTAAELAAPRLRFDEAIPSRSDTRAYQGLRAYGAYSLDKITGTPRLLLAYPSAIHAEVEGFHRKLLDGSGNYPGFAKLFGLPPDRTPTVDRVPLPMGLGDAALRRLRDALARWASEQREHEPDLALVIVPATDRWIVDTPYYVIKEFFAQRGTPSQMVTEELLRDTGRLGWSLANIALASFAKLGGVPWVVESRGQEGDVVVGVGRADVLSAAGVRRRIFGYAVAFGASGAYLSTHSFKPADDERDYTEHLTEAIEGALREPRQTSQPAERVVIHLSRRTGNREIRAAQEALKRTGMTNLPVAFLRIDDSSLFEFLEAQNPTYAPPKGLTLRLTDRRALVQVESGSTLGPARRPLLVELDPRSTVDPGEDFGSLVLQVFRLGHANWRGFNARSKPVTLLYGERLAELVGYMTQRGEWDPSAMRAELASRPWFL